MVLYGNIRPIMMLKKKNSVVSIMNRKVKATGLPAAILFVGIHTKYNFCVSFHGTKVGIEAIKRKKARIIGLFEWCG